ncbi:MAG: hypothetical protein ABIJ12_06595, partial [bacterium]
PGIAGQLLQLQANNPWVTTMGGIEQQIDAVTINRQLYLNYLVMLLNDTINNRKDDAILLLENEGTVESKQTLVATYMADNDYTKASAKLSEIQVNNPYVSDWVQLNQILLTLFQQDKSLYELNNSEIVFIRDLAYKCPAGLGTANAQSILELLFSEEVPECPDYMSTKKKNEQNHYGFINHVSDQLKIELGDNYPEPSFDYTIIPYSIPNDLTGIIKIHDIFGRNMNSYHVSGYDKELIIDTKDWSAGTYSYTLFIDGMSPITKKMVVGQ